MTGEEWIEGHAGYLQEDCCLIWPFGRNSTGYGLVTIDGEQTYAHRAMCKRVHGEPPTAGHQAAHSCGRSHDACVNPCHLSWKTPAENQQDRKDMRDRPKRKLTAENADDIRTCKGREKVTDTAERYGITEAAVRQIQAGKLWRESRRQERIFTEAEVHHIRREAEAYRQFPDVIEPVDYHPLGKIVVDNGPLRYAFLMGAKFANGEQRKETWTK